MPGEDFPPNPRENRLPAEKVRRTRTLQAFGGRTTSIGKVE